MSNSLNRNSLTEVPPNVAELSTTTPHSIERKIMVAATSPVTCPKCSAEFPLQDGLTRRAMEDHEHEFEAELDRQTALVKDQIVRDERHRVRLEMQAEIDAIRQSTLEADRKNTAARLEAEEKLKSEIVKLKRTASQREQDTKDLEQQIASERERAAKLAEKKFADRLAEQAELLNENAAKLAEYREKELELRRSIREVEDGRANLELDLQRRLQSERESVEARVRETEAERFRLERLDLEKKISDAKQANDDLRRKLDQGSSQLTGEVLELDIEQTLQSLFAIDSVEPIGKGVRGADVLQTVRSRSGQICGSILWESKRAANWSPQWVQKLIDNQRAAAASIAVLVTVSMPKGETRTFYFENGVWIVSMTAFKSMAEILRLQLQESARLRSAGEAADEAKSALFDYVCSPSFVQKVSAAVKAAIAIGESVSKERRSYDRLWKEREQQAHRIVTSMAELVGDIRGLGSEGMPGLAHIPQLELTSGDCEIES